MIGLKIIIILLLVLLGVIFYKYGALKKDAQILAIAYKALYDIYSENRGFKDFEEFIEILNNKIREEYDD